MKKTARTKRPELEETLGGRIQKAREAQGYSNAQLARRIGVLPRTLKNWETDRSEPRVNKMQHLAAALNVPFVWLLGADNGEFHFDSVVNITETALLARKVDKLVKLQQQAATLIFEVQSEVSRLQGEIDRLNSQAGTAGS